MKRFILHLLIILTISVPFNNSIKGISDYMIRYMNHNRTEQYITPMEALDLVKERCAANFDKVYEKQRKGKYYYKLAGADYYLIYEGKVGEERDYLIHLYEFVIDEYDTDMGHTVTYGWYTVDREDGSITEQIN